MPIGEAHKTGQSFTGIFEYILAEGKYEKDHGAKKPEIIFQNFSLEKSYKSLGNEFRIQANENKKVIKPVFHLTLNFSKKDGISELIQLEFLQKLMKEMNIHNENHQYIVVRHNDKHPHYHIIVNRVGLDYSTLSDKNSKLRVGTAVDKIEKEMKIDNYLEKSRKFIYDPNSEKGYRLNDKLDKGKKIRSNKDKQIGIRNKKDFIQIRVLRALKDSNVVDLKSLKEKLSQSNIDFKYTLDSKNRLGISFNYNGISVKGSQIGLKGGLVSKQLTQNHNNFEMIKKSELKKNDYQCLVSNLDSVFRELEKEYRNGELPSFKDVFSNNGLILTQDGKIKYNSVQISINNFDGLKNKWDSEFFKAKEEYHSSVESYNSLMNTKPKTGIMGILLPNQIKFNDELAKQKEYAYKPELNFQINVKSQGDLITLSLASKIDKIEDVKIDKKETFDLEDDLKSKLQDNYEDTLFKSKDHSLKNTIDEMINSSSKQEDYENQNKRKSKFRR